jgi:hypothetical protein
MVRYIALVLGVLLILVGGTFFLQGIGVLPGSYMTGQALWAWIGLFCLVMGAGALFLWWRARRIP